MAVPGSGTQADPYRVSNWDELLEAKEKTSDNYIILVNDIDAPESSVSIRFNKTVELDGKGFSINNLRCSSGACLSFGHSPATVRNINFSEFYYSGNSYFLALDAGNNSYGYIYNTTFSGALANGGLIFSNAQLYVYERYLNQVAANLEFLSGSCCFYAQPGIRNNSFPDVHKFLNIRVKYVNCTPTRDFYVMSDSSIRYRTSVEDSIFKIEMPNSTTTLNFNADIKNCLFYGVAGAEVGMTINPSTSGSLRGVNLVEDTLHATSTSSTVRSIPTSTFKSASALHDVGLAIGLD